MGNIAYLKSLHNFGPLQKIAKRGVELKEVALFLGLGVCGNFGSLFN